MTSRWERSLNSLLVLTVDCAVGTLGCRFLSNRGNIWERYAIASLSGLVGAVIATVGLASVY